jgi:hypothetical protein
MILIMSLIIRPKNEPHKYASSHDQPSEEFYVQKVSHPRLSSVAKVPTFGAKSGWNGHPGSG